VNPVRAFRGADRRAVERLARVPPEFFQRDGASPDPQQLDVDAGRPAVHDPIRRTVHAQFDRVDRDWQRLNVDLSLDIECIHRLDLRGLWFVHRV
jgi:hypothetical protein